MNRFLKLYIFGHRFDWLGRIASLMSSPLPPFGRSWRQEISVRVFRIVLLLSALLYPSFGVVYLAVYPEVIDPMWIRLALSGAAMLLLMASYRSDLVRQNSASLLVLVAYLDMLWFAVLAYLNDLSYPYALGLLFVYVAAAILSSLSFERIGPLIGVLLVGLGIVVATALAVPEPQASVVLLILCTASAGIAMYVMVAAFIQALAILDRQHSAMIAAQRVAQVGSWEFDYSTGHYYWSEGMFALLGMDADRERPSVVRLIRMIVRDDRAVFVKALRGEESDGVLTALVVPEGEEPRQMRFTWAADRDPASRAVRYHGTVRDVSEESRRELALVAARDEAERAREAAEELAEVKSTLLQNMSHEIRTPLTAIIGFSEVLALEAQGHSRDYAQLIGRSGHRLLHTLNSVLDLAGLRSGTLELSRLPIDPAESLQSVLAAFSRQMEEKNLRLSLSLPQAPTRVSADPAALDRVLTNLLSNAVKFTDQGGIAVRVQDIGGMVLFQIADTGTGMSAEYLPHLFEEFRQESEGVRRSHEGSGLGLAITRQLVDLMGGRIEVESEVGQGTTVRVVLPGYSGNGQVAAPESPCVTVGQREFSSC